MKIICIGDSLTRGFPFDEKYSWPYILGQDERFETVNLGRSGETSGQILRRIKGTLNQEFSEGRAGQPERSREIVTAIITAGSNDFIFRENTVDGAFENIREIADFCRGGNVVPVIGVPILCNPSQAAREFMPELGLSYEGVNDMLAELRNKIIAYGQSENVRVLDFQERYMSFNKYVDGLHPVKEGYRLFAEVIKEEMGND